MIRPHLLDQDGARERLADAMVRTEYPHLDAHLGIIDNAIVFECMDGEKIAGYVWFYRILGDEGVWTIHVLVLDGHQRQFFYRSVVNSFFGAMYSLGCDTVRAENDNQDMLRRVGGKQTGEYVDLQLPHIWR